MPALCTRQQQNVALWLACTRPKQSRGGSGWCMKPQMQDVMATDRRAQALTLPSLSHVACTQGG